MDVVKNGQAKRKEEFGSDQNVIPVLFSLKVQQNVDMVKLLENTAIAKCSGPCSIDSLKSKIVQTGVPITGMKSISPNKFLLYFDNLLDLNSAIDESGTLWKIFDDVRKWSEGEMFSDRCVWIECFGIPSKYWSVENVKKIGEQWGPVICLDEETKSMNCITQARMLVWTNAQNKIEAHVRLVTDQGGFDVWVKETHQYPIHARQSNSMNDVGVNGNAGVTETPSKIH